MNTHTLTPTKLTIYPCVSTHLPHNVVNIPQTTFMSLFNKIKAEPIHPEFLRGYFKSVFMCKLSLVTVPWDWGKAKTFS